MTEDQAAVLDVLSGGVAHCLTSLAKQAGLSKARTLRAVEALFDAGHVLVTPGPSFAARAVG